MQRPHQRLFDRKLGIPIARRSNRSPKDRAKKALCLSSPVGVGHARRDLANVRELRQLHPDLQVD